MRRTLEEAASPDLADRLVQQGDWYGKVVRTRKQAFSIIRSMMTYAVRFDLDGDGLSEVVALVAGSDDCSFERCIARIYGTENGASKQIGAIAIGPGMGACLTDETVAGRKVLSVSGRAAVWNGSRYEDLCVDGCEEEDALNPPAAETLKLRAAVRAHASCFLNLGAIGRVAELYAASRALAKVPVDRWIPLQRRKLSGEEWSAIRQQILAAGRLQRIDYALQILAHVEPPTMAAAWLAIRTTMVRSARYDFDGDGRSELVYVLDHPDACPPERMWCLASVLRRRGTEWAVMASIPIDRGENGLCAVASGSGRSASAFSRRGLMWSNEGRFDIVPLDAYLNRSVPSVDDDLVRREGKFLDELRAIARCRSASLAK